MKGATLLQIVTFLSTVVTSWGRVIPDFGQFSGVVGGFGGHGGAYAPARPALRPCQVSGWGEWTSKPNIFGCGDVFKFRQVIGIRHNCIAPKTVIRRRVCGPPTISQTSAALKDHFFRRYDHVASSAQGAVDIIFVVDSSGSLGLTHFETIRTFLKFVVMKFPGNVSPDDVRMGVITYSDKAKVQVDIGLDDNKDRQSLLSAVSQLTYTEGIWTYTGEALNRANLILQTDGRPGARQVVFLLTDGKSSDPGAPGDANPIRQSLFMKSREVDIFALGITPNIDEQQLSLIATSPDHMFYCATYDDVISVVQTVENMNSDERY